MVCPEFSYGIGTLRTIFRSFAGLSMQQPGLCPSWANTRQNIPSLMVTGCPLPVSF